MNGHRQAAVTLHALAAADRAWILAALPPADRQMLGELIGELDALGFDGGALVMPTTAERDRAAPSAHARIEQASAEQLFAVLQHEPATLIAQLLEVTPWHWKTELLAMLAPPRRALVLAAAETSVESAPVRLNCLLALVDDALASAPANAPAPTGKRAPGLPEWMRRWTR